jgi:hypothetical protein
MSTKPDPRSRPPASPEIEPPGALPKRFPTDPEPLASRQEKKAEAEKSASAKPADHETPPTRLGSGEDPQVESGIDKNDPEQPASSDDDVEKSFE